MGFNIIICIFFHGGLHLMKQALNRARVENITRKIMCITHPRENTKIDHDTEDCVAKQHWATTRPHPSNEHRQRPHP